MAEEGRSNEREGSEDATDERTTDQEGNSRGMDVDAAAVRVGDDVVYTDERNGAYEFTVAGVEEPWITFENGQMVHWDRFDREDFVVARSSEETKTEHVGVEDTGRPEASGSSAGPSRGSEPPGDDAREVPTPNAN